MGGSEDGEGIARTSHDAIKVNMTDRPISECPTDHTPNNVDSQATLPDIDIDGASDPDEHGDELDGRGARAARKAATNTTSTNKQPTHTALDREASPNSSDRDLASLRGTYGTRSRNRPGRARINYAEDLELDYEHTNGVDHGNADSARQSSADPPSPKQAPVEKRSAAVNGSRTSEAQAAATGLNNTQSASAAVSRKRKAQTMQNGTGHISGQAAAAPVPAVPATTQHTTSATTRRSVPQSSSNIAHASNIFTFERSKALVKNGKLVADDGTVFRVEDWVYLICEPPGDPYYVGRIMEFRYKKTDDSTTPVEGLRMNWAYRARDVQRFTSDTRLLYATMHSDIVPMNTLRGKCKVSHRSEFKDLDEYRKQPDCFWYNQIFDRFIHRYYEVIPVAQIINVPTNVKRALDERWKYVVVEPTRVKELTSAVKLCKRCGGYCANHDSVDCAICNNSYHMNCVNPPLLKKPARGFAWACGPCSRAQERKLEARRTPNISELGTEPEEEEIIEEEDPVAGAETGANTPKESDDRPPTEAEIAHARMWPMRYLGIHCRVEDALQYDDRAIYPRASSRIGPRHQATMLDWPGRPFELVKPKEIKRKYIKTPGSKKDTKLTKETIAAIEADKVERANRPKWVQDEPVGYIHRGEDIPNKDPANTAKLLFTMPTFGEHSDRGLDDDQPTAAEADLDAYMRRTEAVAKTLGIRPWSTDFLDRAVYLYRENNCNADAAIKILSGTQVVGRWPKHRLELRSDLREPRFTLTKEEIKKFEEGVAQFGSELRSVRLHVGTVPHADIVRFWYYWKKTTNGREIWGSYARRKNKGKKQETEAASKLLDDIADDHDDSAFDNDKVSSRQRKMVCKFCNARRSRIWRRAPDVAPGQTVAGSAKRDKNEQLVVALCQRCARLWRRYATQWEECDETAKKVIQAGGRSLKRHYEEELIREWEVAQTNPEAELERLEPSPPPAPPIEPAKKKIKGINGTEVLISDPVAVKKRAPPAPPPPPPKEPTPPPPPIIPTPPKMRQFPCAICVCFDVPRNPLIMCRGCRLTVHQSCYGVQDARVASEKFWCDMCSNDALQSGAPMPGSLAASLAEPASYDYTCRLCPITERETDLIELPRTSHKKKSDRDREKERLEKELGVQMLENYQKSQVEKGRPTVPREALKRTADNNWVHAMCAVFTPEIKFSNAIAMEVAEGIPAIPRSRWEESCTICKKTSGACISCTLCAANFHVGCAAQANYIFGFDITPVKGSRRDSVNIVSMGAETGTVIAGVWCKSHEGQIKTIVHPMQEQMDESSPTALSLYVSTYKQADLAYTGTMRKANALDESTKVTSVAAVTPAANRRVSTAAANTKAARNSISNASVLAESTTRRSTPISQLGSDFHCTHCEVGFSPVWYAYNPFTDAMKGHGSNGNGEHEVSHKTEPSQGDGLRINGVRSSRSPTPAAADQNENLHECSRCHWQRLNEPEEFRKARDPPPPEPPAYREPQEPARPPPPNMGYPSIPGMPLPPPPSQHVTSQHPGWGLPHMNGYAPPAPVHHPHHYPPMYQTPPLPGPPGPPPPQHVPYSVPLPAHGHYPPPGHGQPPPRHMSHHAPPQPISNGHASPHSHHMNSPSQSQPPQILPPASHIAGSPYPPSYHAPQYAPPPQPQHHASPSLPGPPPVGQLHSSPLTGPPPQLAMQNGMPAGPPPPSLPRPSTPRDTPGLMAGTANRSLHGASASPSVKNLLDD